MYDLLLNEHETMIAASVREFLEAELPVERLRPHAKPTDTAAAWTAMAELGWFGVGLPESAGGSGMGLAEELLIQRECGRHLVSPCVLATILAGHVCHHAGNDDAAATFVSGSTMAALALDAAPAAAGDERTVLTLDWDGNSPIVYWSATAMFLFDPAAVRNVAAATPLDESVAIHRARLSLPAAKRRVDQAQAPLADRANVLIAAALVGLAGHALDLTVNYASVREQFGKPIGSFQAVKHRCADMAVRHRLAWYQTCLAALKLEERATDAPLQIASARLLAAEAATGNGKAGIQIHGGIGFQMECDVHWFLKRAMVYGKIGGSAVQQAERVIAQPQPDW